MDGSELQSVGRRIRTLHVDDEPGFAELAAEFLERSEPRIEVVTATDTEAALATLESETFECVVSDYDMPGCNGIELLGAVRQRHPDLPFILFTGKGSEEIASEAISAGVTDYLQKERGTDHYTVLANRIVNGVERYRAESDLARQTDQHRIVADLGRRALDNTATADLFEEAVRLVAASLDCAYAGVFRHRPERADLLLVAGVGWRDGTVGSATADSADDGRLWETLTELEPLVTEDFETDSRFGTAALLADHGVVAGITTVVGSVDDPFGVLGVYATERRSFSDHDVTFVQNVANVLAAAIDRRESERRLRRSEVKFREIAELSPDGIFRCTVDGHFDYLSPAAESMLAVDADTVDDSFQTFLSPESFEDAMVAFGAVVGGDVVEEVELELVDADGESLVVAVSASPIYRDGAVRFVQGFARDIGEYKRRESALRQHREQYRTLAENFPGGVFLFDETLTYTLAGGADLSLVDLTPEEVVGETPGTLFDPPVASRLERHGRAALDGETTSFEHSFQGRTYQVRTLPVRGADDEVERGMLVASRDTDHPSTA